MPRAGRRRGLLAPALLALAAVAGGSAAALELTPAERAGRLIYLEGESPSGGDITARIGRDGTPLPGSAMPCGSCHGADGQGRPEGGAVPSVVTWSHLAKPYGHVHPGGRKHPPFDEAAAMRAIREGVDPAGNEFDPIMPRYSMSGQDLASLVAYLKRVEEDLDPGISASALRIGAVLPLQGRLAETGRAMRGVLEAYLARLNERGGVNGRSLELVAAGYDGDRENGIAGARALVGGGILALVSAFVPGAEKELAELVEAEKVPLVGPFAPQGWPSGAGASQVFQLSPGLGEQARVLAAFAAREISLEGKPIGVLHGGDPGLAGAARDAAASLRAMGRAPVQVAAYQGATPPRAMVAGLRDKKVEGLLFLGGDAGMAALAAAARDLGWRPTVLGVGSLAGRAAAQVPASFAGRLFLAYPAAPSDEKPGAAAELAGLRSRAGLSGRPRAPDLAAYTAAVVLCEALKRAGRSVSRERLIASLESIHGLETGLGPPISFGPGRRVGARGAYVVRVEPGQGTFRPASEWMALE